jgi:hypothetical protein
VPEKSDSLPNASGGANSEPGPLDEQKPDASGITLGPLNEDLGTRPFIYNGTDERSVHIGWICVVGAVAAGGFVVRAAIRRGQEKGKEDHTYYINGDPTPDKKDAINIVSSRERSREWLARTFATIKDIHSSDKE